MKLTDDREEEFRLKFSQRTNYFRTIYDSTLNSDTTGVDANKQFFTGTYALKKYVTDVFDAYVDTRISSYRFANVYPDDQDHAEIVYEFHCIATSQINHLRSHYEALASEVMKR
jgi:hypothetical protein